MRRWLARAAIALLALAFAAFWSAYRLNQQGATTPRVVLYVFAGAACAAAGLAGVRERHRAGD